MIFHKHRDILSHRPWRGYYTDYTKKGQAPPLSLQGAFSDRKVAAIATFKKDTTLERQGEFTLSTLQGRCSRRRGYESEALVPDGLPGERIRRQERESDFRLTIHTVVHMHPFPYFCNVAWYSNSRIVEMSWMQESYCSISWILGKTLLFMLKMWECKGPPIAIRNILQGKINVFLHVCPSVGNCAKWSSEMSAKKLLSSNFFKISPVLTLATE